ncbi:MAG: ABC transporter permease [Treponema sp.]|jgi:ABC-type nitrate/sulfonate/bicarbonate transport system permease component|nr:ABC transporter permease [Treponema sp.]
MELRKKARGKTRPFWVLPAQLALLVLILGGVEIAVSRNYINRIFLASPTQIVDELLYILGENILWEHLSISLQEFFVGYLLAAAAGCAIGVLFVVFPRLEMFLNPYVAAVMAVPKIAIMPLLLIWFGIGFTSKIVLVFLFCVFTILFNTITGAKETPAGFLKVAGIFKATRTQTVFKVLLPAALPGIFAGLRITAGTALTGVLFAEMQVSKKGLGYLLVESQAVLNTPRIFLVIILITILAVLFVGIVNMSERLICHRWKA